MTWKRFPHCWLLVMVTRNVELMCFFPVSLDKLLTHCWITGKLRHFHAPVTTLLRHRRNLNRRWQVHTIHTNDIHIRYINHITMFLVWWQAPDSNFLHHYFPWPRDLAKWLLICSTLKVKLTPGFVYRSLRPTVERGFPHLQSGPYRGFREAMHCRNMPLMVWAI